MSVTKYMHLKEANEPSGKRLSPITGTMLSLVRYGITLIPDSSTLVMRVSLTSKLTRCIKH